MTSMRGARRASPSPSTSASPRPTYLFQTYPKRWMDQYSGSGLLVQDPTVHWGMNNVGRVRWSDLEAIDSHGVLERAKDFGIMNGVTIAVLIAGSRSIASFARADRDYDEARSRSSRTLLGAPAPGDARRSGELSASDRRALTELSIRLTH